ncbi:MAG: TauD/TfdA dioxygenase family protein, partial [Geminicoccales bacterium]
MQAAGKSPIKIRPAGAALGADVENVDVEDLSDAAFAAIRTALLENLVVRIRGTAIDDASFLALARRLGEVEPPEERTRTLSMTVPGFPEMSIISNVVENGVAKGESGDGELRWHTDHGFMETPVALSMLLAREVPAGGGDTSFVNMYRAWEELPQGLREQIEGRSIKHQASHSSTGQRRPGHQDIASDDPRELPGAVHPIVRTHPETGRRALYLGRRFGSYVPTL